MRFERRSEKTLWLAILLHPVAFFCFLFAWQYVGVKMRKWTEPAYTDEWSITLGIVLSGVVTVWSASGYAIGVWACWDRVHLIPARQLAGAGMLVIIIIVAGVFGLSLVGELAPGHVMQHDLLLVITLFFFPLGAAAVTYGVLKTISKWHARESTFS